MLHCWIINHLDKTAFFVCRLYSSDEGHPQQAPQAAGSQQMIVGPADDRRASDEDPDQDTPSRQRATLQSMTYAQTTSRTSSSRSASRQEAQGRQYCTQKCLLRLVNRGTLDNLCPNVQEHGKDCH
jgi:hypothetical protein